MLYGKAPYTPLVSVSFATVLKKQRSLFWGGKCCVTRNGREGDFAKIRNVERLVYEFNL